MKLGDLIHIVWQHSHGSVVNHSGLFYRIKDDIYVSLNDLRAIWEYLNQDVPLEGTIMDACTGERASYISEENIKNVNNILEDKNVLIKIKDLQEFKQEFCEHDNNSELGYISKSDILHWIENLKCNKNIPKNYGTILDIMRYIYRMPAIYLEKEDEQKCNTEELEEYGCECIEEENITVEEEEERRKK